MFDSYLGCPVLDGGSPIPASLSGRWTPSVGKFGRIPMACRMALLSIPYIVVSCLSFKTPRCVAWYFDLSSCSIIAVL